MKHIKAFEDALASIHGEGRYRVFVDLHRQRGQFPLARARFPDQDEEKDIVVWCSNDYLAMGQDDDVVEAMHEGRVARKALWRRKIFERIPRPYPILIPKCTQPTFC